MKSFVEEGDHEFWKAGFSENKLYIENKIATVALHTK